MPNKEPDTVFLYDAVGNREYLSYAYGKIRYNYGLNNELLYQDINKTGGVRYVYDANGNLIKEDHLRGKDVYKQVNLSWDSENRLKQMQYPFTNKSKMKGKEKIKDSFLEFEYDGDGNRIRKTSLYGTKKKKETVYLRDASGSVIEEYITRYDLNELPEMVITNIYVAGVYKIQTKCKGGTKETNEEYFSKDTLGSTALITDPTGKVIQRYKYSPFGNIDYSKGSSDNNYQFTGKEVDPESGLIYYGDRYLDPTTGRWNSRDSIAGNIANPPSLNRYVYTFNNPLRYIDENGRWSILTKVIAYVQFRIYETTPYHLGGGHANQPEADRDAGLDCSSLMRLMYPIQLGGLDITAQQQYDHVLQKGARVIGPQEAVETGDIGFYYDAAAGRITHVVSIVKDNGDGTVTIKHAGSMPEGQDRVGQKSAPRSWYRIVRKEELEEVGIKKVKKAVTKIKQKVKQGIDKLKQSKSKTDKTGNVETKETK